MTDLNASAIQLRTFTGEQAKPFIPELARLRITVFRDYPYLYDGSMGYEKEYLQTYMRSSESIPDDHPLKPANYTSLESFWQRRGFKKAHDMACNMSWKDLDQPNETDKQLQFWMKNL